MSAADHSRDAQLANCRRQVIDGELGVGSTARITRTFSHEDIETFGRVSGDRNPYHFDEAFAEDSLFGRPIAHGLMVAAMLTEVGGQWAWLATSMAFDFLAPVHAGDTITLEIVIESLSEKNFAQAQACWTNQDGKVVLRGSLGGYLPTARQRELLASQKASHTPE